MSAEVATVVMLPGAGIARRYVALRELQQVFGFGERWWRYRIAEGMPVHRYAGSLRFDVDECRAWLEEQSHGV